MLIWNIERRSHSSNQKQFAFEVASAHLLRLPPHVQEDLKAQVEALYLKYYALRIIGSPQEKSKDLSGHLETSHTPTKPAEKG